MLIQSKLPATPTVNNIVWSFAIDRAGRYVCNVTDERSIAMLLSVENYFEAAPLDPVKPIFQAEPEKPRPDAKPAKSKAPEPAPADAAGSTEQPMSEAEATAMFQAIADEKLAKEGAEAVARQNASLAEAANTPVTDPSPGMNVLGAPSTANPLDPNNEFPMDPGETINPAAIGRIVEGDPNAAPSGVIPANAPSAEDPQLTNAQVAAKKKAAAKRQTKRTTKRK